MLNFSIPKIMRAYIRNESGNFAIVFALSFLTLTTAVGAAVDYNAFSGQRKNVQYAADAGVLAAVRHVESEVKKGTTLAIAKKRGRKVGRQVFKANLGVGKGSKLPGKFKLKLKRDDEGTHGALSFKGEYDTVMVGIFGVSSLDYTIEANADYADGIVNYIELHIVVDTSASMGLPSTNADQVRLGALKGCSFACHNEIAQWRAQGIVFRIDVVRDAVLQMLSIFEDKGYIGDRMAISVYTFGTQLRQGVAPNTNVDVVRSFVSGIDLESDSGTDIGTVMSQLSTRLPKSGDGRSPDDRKLYVVLFTDGLTHGNGNSSPMIYSLKVFDPNHCMQIKANNEATMFVFNVEYIANLIGLSCPTGHGYCAINSVMKPSIAPRLQQCASLPEYFLPAETPEQIAASIEVFTDLIVEQALSIAK
ncbi:MAG: hypothetical protein COA43_04065 [Robiginitomaculum sp.]|nr:MAG: hypothetical protein COA43_04065 [Robiginitomaculum sp.]